MARWKELPATLDQRERQLVVQLRRLKDHSGLSFAALAARTTYSSSSWERWFNGKKRVPRRAVIELAQACGTDPVRLLALHEIAEEARGTDAAASGEGKAGPPVPAARVADRDPVAEADARSAPKTKVLTGALPRPRSRLRYRIALGVAGALAAVFAVGLITGMPLRDDASGTAPASNAATDYRYGKTYACDVSRKDNGLHAGYSIARDSLLDINSTGWDVVEAQCLVRWHGSDPGDTDGVYGQRTKDAVTAFQKQRGIGIDGIVGPDTWGELRR
ncbi:helix-turn-helix domain-containing protein [Streptomyces pacificus]|uniref:Helix-turn-helix domain-containing protein n=1 Tax=Streptomyces pacificus TaxID=2705029 RepID=A0A6A0AYD6_9ACTN|nr:helix-turn-helix domain-containing protein [Streptomyces pacificus]GFH37916.1 helix-turn-helix domain-containing protein [Streptomyces pacificus]